jgi:hypothetical protein
MKRSSSDGLSLNWKTRKTKKCTKATQGISSGMATR